MGGNTVTITTLGIDGTIVELFSGPWGELFVTPSGEIFTCGTTPKAFLHVCSVTEFQETPSMEISPSVEARRSRAESKVLFPEPVLPNTPTYGQQQTYTEIRICTIINSEYVPKISTSQTQPLSSYRSLPLTCSFSIKILIQHWYYTLRSIQHKTTLWTVGN